jgi:hypothetical protein
MRQAKKQLNMQCDYTEKEFWLALKYVGKWRKYIVQKQAARFSQNKKVNHKSSETETSPKELSNELKPRLNVVNSHLSGLPKPRKPRIWAFEKSLPRPTHHTELTANPIFPLAALPIRPKQPPIEVSFNEELLQLEQQLEFYTQSHQRYQKECDTLNQLQHGYNTTHDPFFRKSILEEIRLLENKIAFWKREEGSRKIHLTSLHTRIQELLVSQVGTKPQEVIR